MKKYLYVVDYWVPFPASEYGGLVTLIAENDAELNDGTSPKRLKVVRVS